MKRIRRNRASAIIFIAALLLQTVFANLGMSLQVQAEGNEPSTILADGVIVEEGDEEAAVVAFKWTLDESVVTEQTYTASVPENTEIAEKQSGDLLHDEKQVGTYEAEANGEVSVLFDEGIEGLEEAATGTFTVNVVVEAEEAEEVVEEEAAEPEVEDPVKEEEVTGDENKGTTEEDSEVEGNEEKTEEEVEPEEKNMTKEKQQDKKEEKVTEQQEQKNNRNALTNGENHGFNLTLNKATDMDGKPYNDDYQLELSDEFYLDLEWNLENGHNYMEGDVETFQLPNGIKIQEEFEIELKSDGLDVAKAVIKTDGTVELTFTDFVETHSNVKGHMQIVSMIDEENAEVEDGEIVLKPIGDEGEIRIPIDLGNREKTIEKAGTPNKGYNADEIKWEVTINKMKNDLKNAKVTDVLPVGTEYKAGSLKVTKLKVDLNGNILDDLEEVEITGDTVADGKFNIPLGDIKDAYKIEYVTTVIDHEKKTFNNNATLSDDKLDEVSAHATATINRGDPIKKSAANSYNPKTGIIEWEMEFNFNQKDLEKITLKDVWKPIGKMHLVEDSLKFQEVTIDENGKAHNEGEAINLPEGATLVNGDDQFEVTGITTDKAYKITYQTKVNDRVLDDFKVSNTAGFGNEADGSGTGVGTYYGSKSAGNIDYKDKTIDWKIQLNHDEYPMEKISILDTLGDGLTLDKESIKITVDGEKYTGDYTVSDNNPFELKFPKKFTTDKKIVIKYKTDFVADEVTDNIAKNKADITWTPGDGGGSITKEVKAEKPLNKRTEDNSWKKGSYNPETKEITWTIFTNYRENQIENLIVKDEPQGNQKIVKDSAVVTELEVLADGKIKDTKVLSEDVSTIDKENNSLTVNIGKTNKAYKIEYKTSLEGLSDIQKEYVNEAEVFDGDELLSSINAKVGIAKAHTYAAKSGKQEGKQVHWAVTVNPGQQKVQNLKLIDTVSANQDILTDTFKVYEATVNNKGEATKKGEPISSDQYELKHEEGEPTFTVKWNDTVERAYIVEYSTLFFAGHNEDVTNSYDVTGDNIVDGGKTDGEGSVKIEQFGSGGGSGEAGYLVIDKVDTTYGQDETKLEGAKFELVDADTGKVLKSGITDENGQIDFGRLLFGKYQLKETTIPEGYVTPKEEQTITIDKVYKSGDDKEGFEYRVENYVPVFAVGLSKTDDKDNALKGAEFSLFDSDDNKLQTKVTDKEGKILFEDIENAGDYYVQETKAPAGYILNEEKYKVTIDAKQHEPVKVSAKNKERGTVRLTKTDVDTGEALAGVKFVLQKENNSGGYDTVSTHTTNNKGQVRTSNTLEAGNYQFVETEGLDGYRTNGKPVKFTVKVNSTKTQKLTMTNEQYKGSVKLIKKDAATNDLLKGAEFKIVDSDGKVVEENVSTNNKGEVVFDDLFLGDYQITETKAPKGYELVETPIEIEVTEDNQVIEKTMTNKKLMNISVEKEWNNAGGKTQPVTVKILPTEETVELNEGNDWKATFDGLYVYDDAGEEIDYKVEEIAVDGFNSSVTGDASDGFTVTNTEVTSVSGEKTWLDDDSEYRPNTITVELLANEEKVAETDVTKQSGWNYSFNNLDKYDANGDKIDYTISEVSVEGYKTNIETTDDGFDIENVRQDKTSISGEKTWKDEDPTDRPLSIDVELTRKVKDVVDEDFSESINVTPNGKGEWIYTFDNLDEFDENGVAYTYIITEDNVPKNYESNVTGHDIENVRVGETEVSGTKRWKDDKVTDRPESITVNLLRNNVVVESTDVTADDNWKYTFTELDKYDKDGQYYNYTVKEEQVPGYAPEITGDDITNTRSEKTSIEITKGWLDDNSTERPEDIIVYVYQNDKLFDTVEVKAADEWVHELTDLEAYDKDGQPYTYTVKEKPVEGYESTVDGFNITNLRVGETEISGTKTWKDNDDATGDRPESITINLLQNGEKVDSQEITADDNWEYSFEKLDKYNDQGVVYGYTIDEEPVEGYEKSGNGSDLTNTRTGTTEVSGEKIWMDNEDATEDRPDEITVHLLQNGSLFTTATVTAEDDWKYNFEHLPRFDDNGVEYGYTIDEVDVEGYTKSADGTNLINTRTGLTDVSGEKIWQDNDDATGDRPDSITVNLLQNGTIFAVTEATAENNWQYSFDNVPRFDENGVEWGYTVDEVDVEGYAKSADGNDLINTRVGETEVSGTKIWLDNDDATGDRPEEITVQLLQNGTVFAEEIVTVEDEWEYSFTHLPRFDDNGVEWGYTVDEVDVEGYNKSAEGNDLINTRAGTTEVAGTKTWLDNDDATENRPESITVNLFQNETLFTSVEVTAADDWEYNFTHLDKYDDQGVSYKYTVEEVVPENYAATVTGYDITNLRVGTIEVTGEKTWVEVDAQYRPDKITVNLLANGEKVDSIKVSEETNWTFEFTELDQFDAEGKEIGYTVEEVDVAGYTSEVEGYTITNTQETTEQSGTKTWIDQEDTTGDRPDSITVQVMNGSEVVQEQEVTVNEAGNWNYMFTDLPKFDKEGNEIEYTINELPVPGYVTEIEGSDITNIRSEEVEVTGTKTWKDDQASDRPDSITVQLFANGEKIDSVDVTSETDWTYSFEGLAGFDADGAAIAYTVDEVAVDGYETTINGYDITNTLMPVEPEEPTKPTEPKDPKDPEKPTTPEDPKDPEKPGDKGDGEELPKTATNMFNFLLAGLLLLGSGATALFVQRRRA